MKKFLLLLAAAILVALGLTGISSAYFSDVETSEGNIITAGTTELLVVGQVEFDFEVVGKKRTLKQGSGDAAIALSNTGSTDGVAELRIVNLLNYENDYKKGERKVDGTSGPLEGELGAYLLVTITYNGNPVYLPDEDGEAEVYMMPLDDLNGKNLILGGLAAQDTRIVEIAWELPGGVGKIIENDSVSFCTEFSLGW